jgi:hypothetical protein
MGLLLWIRTGNAEARNHLLPTLPRFKGTAPDKRAPGLQRAPHNGGGGKKGHQVVAAEKDPRAAPELIEN